MSTIASNNGHPAVDEFIEKVRQRLKSLKMTVTQLSEEAEVGRPYLHRVLSGKQEPTMRNAEKIGKPLGLKVRTVIERKKLSKSA